jgi:hypothetical protein
MIAVVHGNAFQTEVTPSPLELMIDHTIAGASSQ